MTKFSLYTNIDKKKSKIRAPVLLAIIWILFILIANHALTITPM